MAQATTTLYKCTFDMMLKHETKRANNKMGHKIGKGKI